jgi:hypothetical protein
VVAAVSIGALAAGGATSAVASSDNGGEGNGAFHAASYINPDGGENDNVDSNSSCTTPDQYDRQEVSTRASGKPGDNNVHNDACFLDTNGNKADGPASFQSFGVGYISACPDPDGEGPKYAILRDTDADGRKDLCFQSGYQESALPTTAGNEEFHTRLNARSNTGRQRVVWCSDANANGCRDEEVKDRIVIRWRGARH